MYIDVIDVEDVGFVATRESLVQTAIISLIPVSIPSKFYYEWPIISAGFLLCWAYIRHQHTRHGGLHMGFCNIVFLAYLSKVLSERLDGEGPEIQQRRNSLSETCSRSMPQWKQITYAFWEIY